MPGIKHFPLPLLLILTGAVLTGCDKKASQETDVHPPQVAVEVIQPRVLSVKETLPGRVTAWRTAEIRPQVNGVIQRRLFEQGAEVTKGTALFQINAAPFAADVANAKAGLLRVDAANDKAQQQVNRLKPLMLSEAVSRQSYDDAVANARQAAADVAQARATLARKQLDLSFATVDAPISGRIDQTLVTEGAYVTPGDTSPLARIYQTDPIYVDVRQPAEVYSQLRRQVGGEQGTAAALPVQVLLPDGTVYQHPGKILFSGISVDAGTGDVLVRIEVKNPNRELLPGMFVRVQIPRQHYDDALMVPQQAVSRHEGTPTLWVVDEQQQAHQVNVDVGELSQGEYRISSGLPAGSRVVVMGMEKLADGVKVAAALAPASPTPLTMTAGE
ncbi:efflux RND transporter periplasmic adaptor subunit [Candidatus Pantoea multigeneris]|uniref:Efflux RND transporter periplasmic adaptor subunit n=1 Tax=Candidatus Pantoea multigeneris TaxID=2608357 RepID=A0ABX0RDC7_9GAMM|nr:efflux RND transporter periplasmic adaptor subunit [Pantoea multigeneris]NIF21684.1 efflux RND transporter periplasmic adaptor subunit [Pantoea multigeneris]